MVIGKMLGHSQPATTARYAHLADDPVKAASDAVGRHIAAAMEGVSGEIIGGTSKVCPRFRRTSFCCSMTTCLTKLRSCSRLSWW